METGQLHSSVAVFRLRCLRVLTLWACEWLAVYQRKSPTDVTRWLFDIQLAYHATLKRSPTVPEWVADLLYICEFDPAQDVLRNILAARRLPVASKLAMAKPYVVRLHQQRYDMDRALQQWSRDVGQAFHEIHSRRVQDALPLDRDWTDPLVIKEFVAKTKHMRRFSLTPWLDGCKLLVKSLMRRREHLRSES